jgi:hypothetical protein
MRCKTGPTVALMIGVALAAVTACSESSTTPGVGLPAAEAAFAEMQARGEQAMGVDQYSSTHVFEALPDGGRIELQRDVEDPVGVTRIREHLQHIAQTFDAGEFATPAFVHMQSVPGGSVMAARRDEITYTYRELPRGGEVRIVTQDPQAREAIHEFLSFQREEHRAGGSAHHDGAGQGRHGHGGMEHGDMDHGNIDHSGMSHGEMDHGGLGHGRMDHGGTERE